MITKVGLQHDKARKLPWRVYWWGIVDPETGKQRKYTRSFRHNREAEEFRVEKQADLNCGGPRDKPDEVRLGRLLDEFFEARVSSLSHSSQTCYDNTMRQLREYFGDTPVRQVKQVHAESFMSSRKRRDGRPVELASASKKQHLTYSRAILNAAVEWEYIAKNPFLPPTRATNTPLRVKVRSRPWQHITPNEFEDMLAVVPNVQRRAAFWLMYACGLRPGEVYNLTADKVDLENHTVLIENRTASKETPPFTIKADGQSTETKARTVPIPKAAMADITRAMELSFRSGGFLVLTPERFEVVQANWQLCRAGKGWSAHVHRPWLNSDMLNNLLRDTKIYLRRAGVELTAPFTLKTFRKSFGQNHADAGTPPKTLAELLGHSDTSVTMEFYNRVTDANKRQAVATMDRILGGSASGKRHRGVV